MIVTFVAIIILVVIFVIFLVFSFQTLKEFKKIKAERRKLEENAVIVTGYHLVCDGNSSPKKITEHSAPFKNIRLPDYAIRGYSEPPMMGVFNETRE
ncbi:MAG: hypothetical protein LBM93_05695 [Oscillospiraceae bacterium]|nr:hypothetical protein [Oscillospiraceae bacterium]